MFINFPFCKSDPIVPVPTAGILDRKDGPYVVNTLIPSPNPLVHMFTLVHSLIWPENTPCALQLRKGGGLLFGGAYPIKREFIDLLPNSAPDRHRVFSGAVKGAGNCLNFS